MTALAIISLTLLFLADLPPRTHHHHERTPMSQEFQSLGSASPELEAAVAEKSGWQGAAPESEIDEITDGSDYSIWDRHTNTQVLGRSIPNMAGHNETSAAAQSVTPYTPHPQGDN